MKPILAIYGIQDRYVHQYPAYTHDHNLTLIQDGEITYYLHLERYTRRKNDNTLHLHIEDIISNELKIKDEFDLVSVNSFVGNSFISKTGKLRIETQEATRILAHTSKASGWFQREPWGGFAPQAYSISHELAHVFSCVPFFGNFKENSLLIHFDGGASLGNFSAFHFKDNKIKLIEYHWDLSHLSKLFNDNALSFALMKAKSGEHCSVPGKLMGYAAMGTANIDLQKWLMNNNYFKDIWKDQTPFYEAAKQWGWNGDLNNNKDTFLMDVAASIQAIFQQGILEKITQLQEKIKANFLYYTGGCALNISTNAKLIYSKLFKDVYIPPACNDSGLSLGAAAFINWQHGNTIKKHRPYLNSYKSMELVEYSKETIQEVAQQIMQGAIIGICNGYAEIGPRALGNRSIIARADSKIITRKVSMECKNREWFRPIAPIMLERNAKKVTALDNIHHLSKYMLLDFTIQSQYEHKLAGVIHQNGTARIQTIYEKNENPFIYDLLNYLDENEDQLALVNTSFNRRGEPIVQSSEDAMKSANEMKLDGILMNGNYIKLSYELERNIS